MPVDGQQKETPHFVSFKSSSCLNQSIKFKRGHGLLRCFWRSLSLIFLSGNRVGTARTVMTANDIFISTTMVESKHRTDFWRAAAGPIFEPSPIPDEWSSPLEGVLRARPLGSLVVGSTTFNNQRFNRDRRSIVQGGLDHYFVQIATSGGMKGDFNGINVQAEVGDILIADLAQTLKSETKAGHRDSVVINRKYLEKAVGFRNLHGVVLKAEKPMTQYLTTCLGGLFELSPSLSDTQAAAVEEAVVALLAAALKGEGLERIDDTSPLSLVLRERVLEFMRQNIHMPEMSLELIQRRFNVSRAHLYRAFATDGGVAKVLRNMRLDTAFLELTKTDRPSRFINEVAFSLGFSNSNQLLRGFRTRFGVTPSEAREAKLIFPSEMRPTPDLLAYFTDVRNQITKL